MKQIIVFLCLFLYASTLAPREVEHEKKFTNYKKGCWKGSCWSICDGLLSWCYTKQCIWEECPDVKIPCDGDTYNDVDCPFYTQEMTLDNCASSCFVV